MIKVFGMARGGTNLLCNMIYSFPQVKRPKLSELQAYVYSNSKFSKLRLRFEKFMYRNYIYVDNYDVYEAGKKKLNQIIAKNGLRKGNYHIKVMNGNIAYYDAINQPGDKNIILLRDKYSVLGSMVRRGATPVAALNNINNFYKFAEYYSRRDNLLVIRFEELLNDYENVLMQVSEYLGYNAVDKVYFGLKPTLTNNRKGKERIYIDVKSVPDYLDKNINEKQKEQSQNYYADLPNELLDLLIKY